jgi:tetratricopeptide (TPR) repeat protein
LLEAEVTGALEHPGIVPVYSLGTYTDGRPYYAMRFVRGESLKQAVARFHGDGSLPADPGERSLELRKLLHGFVDVCNAIQYAHSRGVLHRDIKPSNVIVGNHGETLVVDWGLAKATGRSDPAAAERTLLLSSSGSSETLPGSALGTPAYMSPEQAAGKLDQLCPASDVYSLGATLYFLLTCRPPFDGPDVGAILRSVEQGEFAPPRSIQPWIDRSLEAVCLKAMALRPTDRYSSPKALGDDIERWMADEPVVAAREPVRRRFERWIRHHKPVMAGVMSVVSVSLIALIAGTILLDQANRRVEEQRNLARRQRDIANENFGDARQAVDTLLTEVSEDQLFKAPAMQPLRQKLLRSALGYYRRFVQQRADDPGLRRQLAEAYRRVGEINGELSQRDEAISALEHAAEMFRDLGAREPNDGTLSIGLGRTLQALGYNEIFIGRMEQAGRHIRAAIEVFEPFERARPEVAEYGARLGRCYDLLGGVEITSGRSIAYPPNGDKAIEVLERTIGRHPADLEAQTALIRVLQNYGGALCDIDEPEKGLQFAQRGAEEAHRLLMGTADNAVIRFDLVMAVAKLARAEADLGRFRSADRSIGKTAEIARSLVAAGPTVSRYRSWSLFGLATQARARANMGQLRAASATIQEARGLGKSAGRELLSEQSDQARLAELALVAAQVLSEQAKWADVVAPWEECVQRCTALHKDQPEDQATLKDLILARSGLLQARLRAGVISAGEAASSLGRALAETEADLRRLDCPSLRVTHAEILCQLANFQAEAESPAQPDSVLERAIATLETEVAAFPKRLHWKLALARSLALRGELHQRSGRRTDAIANARRVVELLETTVSEGSGYLYELAAYRTALLALSEHANPQPDRNSSPEFITCLETLTQALKDGFDNTHRLRDDPRLKLLRDRAKPEFDRLIDQAEVNSKAAGGGAESPSAR